MKCPKCNYTSFDYNKICPKCGNDNGEEQARLKFSSNKPNPPFFLASLMGMADSENLALRGGGHMGSSESVYGEMEAQDLLIALDDLDMDGARPDLQKTPDHSKDEIVFETDDSVEEPLSPLEPEDDEILFDLEPASEPNEIEIIDRDPLDKKSFLEQDLDETPVVLEVAETRAEDQSAIPSEGADQAHEMELFLADEPGSPEMTPEDAGSLAFSQTPEETDSPELFLSLEDLSEGDGKPKASFSGHEDEILFELEEPSEQNSKTAFKDTADEKGFWDSEEMNHQLAVSGIEDVNGKTTEASLKGTNDGEKEVNLFSDLDIEPLDLELSLEDMEKKPE